MRLALSLICLLLSLSSFSLLDDNLLLEAVLSGNSAKVSSLLHSGSNANTINNEGTSALMLAANKADTLIAGMLIKHGADINYRSPQHTSMLQYLSVLDCAVLSSDTIITGYLIDKSVNINAQDKSGFDALFTAAFRGDYAMAAFLIKKGAVISDRNAGFAIINSVEKELEENLYSLKTTVKRRTIARLLLEHNYTLNTENEIFLKRSEKQKTKILEHINKIKVAIESDIKEKHFTDSILSLSPAERDSDPIYEYNTIFSTSSEDGIVTHTTKVYKKRRSINIENKLNNTPLTFLLSAIYIFILFLIIRLKFGKTFPVPALIAIIIVPAILSWAMIGSIIFNINELYVRLTGKQIEANVSYTTTEEVGYRGVRYTAYHFTFSYIPADSITRYITANRTSFGRGEEQELKTVTICTNEENGNTAVLLPGHTTGNIIAISLRVVALVLIILLFLGNFNKQIKYVLQKIDKTRQNN